MEALTNFAKKGKGIVKAIYMVNRVILINGEMLKTTGLLTKLAVI
ncbi:hypothetical protein RINTHM_12100 [Richelia intracellularis HM01]|nr:hypothetical protein RINTHM_12100 [Richelia intracellularis HM01]